jgi:hypothetical protein
MGVIVASRRTRKTNPVATQTVELALAVPQVITHRLTRLLLAGTAPSARDRREFHLMTAEKVTAFTESWNAMSVQALHAHQKLALSFMRSFWFPGAANVRPSEDFPLSRTAMGIIQKGMAPVHRRAVANAKRLGRTRLR